MVFVIESEDVKDADHRRSKRDQQNSAMCFRLHPDDPQAPVSQLSADRVSTDDVGIELGAEFGDSLKGLVVDVADAKAARVAARPLEVVHQHCNVKILQMSTGLNRCAQKR